MYYLCKQKTIRHLVAPAFAVCLAVMNQAAQAAPQWTKSNSPAVDSIGLFHFDESSSASLPATPRTGVPAGTEVTHLLNHPDLDEGQRLEHWNFDAVDVGIIAFSSDVAFLPLGDSSLALTGPVRFRASQIYPDPGTKPFTVEAWIKWDDLMTSSDLRLGSGDRAVRIIRDTANPANDRVGFQGSHGVWMPHPAFTGFQNLASPVVDGEWFHIAMVLHNTPMFVEAGEHHYEPGAFAMIFINGELLGAGTANDRQDVSGTSVYFHGSDRLALWQSAGTSRVLIDEFTTWQRDFTNGGANTEGLFNDGRGNINASAENWMLFE